MQIKLILLDFDGTLATTEEANMMAYALALKEEGIELDLAEYKVPIFSSVDAKRFYELIEKK